MVTEWLGPLRMSVGGLPQGGQTRLHPGTLDATGSPPGSRRTTGSVSPQASRECARLEPSGMNTRLQDPPDWGLGVNPSGSHPTRLARGIRLVPNCPSIGHARLPNDGPTGAQPPGTAQTPRLLGNMHLMRKFQQGQARARQPHTTGARLRDRVQRPYPQTVSAVGHETQGETSPSPPAAPSPPRRLLVSAGGRRGRPPSLPDTGLAHSCGN